MMALISRVDSAGDMVDQHAYRHDQVAVDQPQPEQGNQYASQDHQQRAEHDRTVGRRADPGGFALGRFTQLNDQGAQLLAGGTVDAAHGGIADCGIVRGDEGFKAPAVACAQRAVFSLQLPNLRRQGRVALAQHDQPFENDLHLAFLVFEAPPVLFPVAGRATA